MKTININKELNISIPTIYKELLTPDYIFIPIESSVLIKLNDHVLKGQLISDDKYSSISGTFIKEGKLGNKNYVIIKNDYKELKTNTRARNLENVSKDSFLKYYNNEDIKLLLDKDINTLYINAIDNDIYNYNKYTYLKDNIKDVQDMINLLSRIYNIKQIKIVIKNNYKELLDDYKVNVNYHKVDNVYPIGNTLLLSKLILKENDYLIDLNDIIDMIYNVKKNKTISEKYISIGGNYINNQVIYVKKYTYLKDVLNKLNIDENSVDIILNNSLCGKLIDLKYAIIDDDINCIIINKKQDIKEEKCIKCSLCYEVCPLKINPLLKNKKCIKCGLCNYVCPSKINIVKEYQE